MTASLKFILFHQQKLAHTQPVDRIRNLLLFLIPRSVLEYRARLEVCDTCDLIRATIVETINVWSVAVICV